MNGAESLIHTLLNGGVDTCFANPGTSEIHFVKALDSVPGMRAVLGLFEGVCTGAADGYGRMTGRPAATLLHLGPGLANGLANLHNARRAHTPVVNIVGDHATYHRQHDAPLTSDIAGLAQPVSGWVHASADAAALPGDAAAAIQAAMGPPGQVATLILPADAAWSEGVQPVNVSEPAPLKSPDASNIAQAAAALRSGEPSLILIRDSSASESAQRLLARIAGRYPVQIMAHRVNGRLPRGAGRLDIDRFPYPVDQAVKILSEYRHLILVGAEPPVAFFAYPDKPGWLTPESCQMHRLAEADEDGVQTLEALVAALSLPAAGTPMSPLKRPPLPSGPLTSESVWMALASLMPDHAIICDESITSSRNAEAITRTAPPHDWLSLTGGAIGLGLPMAIGAAVACPDRQVFAMQADGSAMYTLQALWTHAREQLNIVTVIFSNRRYAILHGELRRMAGGAAGPRSKALLDLHNPELDWVSLARGMGVPAARAATADDFGRQISAAIEADGPHLIEAVLAG